MRKFVCLYLLLAFSLCATAQKKELSAAKDNLKSGRNLEQSEKDLRKLLEQPANRQNEKIWLTLFDIVKKQYDQGNEKLYLKQNYDTAKIFTLTGNMFDVLERFDSIDAMPDAKGEVKPKHRRKHAAFLNDYRPNLFNGGRYFVNKKNYKEAYRFFNMYINCIHQPLFGHYHYKNDTRSLYEAAYWASFSAYQQKDPAATFHHMDLALKDSVHYSSMLQILADTYQMENDTVRYEETLREGFRKFPLDLYFFRNLVILNASKKEWKDIISISDKGIATDSTVIDFLFAKCTALLNTGRYDESIAVGNKIINLNDSLAETYYNIGLAWFNKAVELDKLLKKSSDQKKKMAEYYRKALPNMENYRKMEPKRIQQWASPLYTIYLNLNMGREFEEIDKLMKQQGK